MISSSRWAPGGSQRQKNVEGGEKGIFQTWVIILSDSVITRKAKEERCIFIIYETAHLSASRSDISHAEYIPCSTGHTFSEWSHLSCWIWHKVQVIDFQRLGLVGGIYRCHQRSSHCSTFIASLTYWNFFGQFEKSMRRLQLLPNGFEATNLTSCLLNSNWCFSLCNKEFNMKKSNIAVNPLQQQAKVIIQG